MDFGADCNMFFSVYSNPTWPSLAAKFDRVIAGSSAIARNSGLTFKTGSMARQITNTPRFVIPWVRQSMMNYDHDSMWGRRHVGATALP